MGNPYNSMLCGHEKDWNSWLCSCGTVSKNISIKHCVDNRSFIKRKQQVHSVFSHLIVLNVLKQFKKEGAHTYMYFLYLQMPGTILEKYTRNFNRFALGEVASRIGGRLPFYCLKFLLFEIFMFIFVFH